MVLANIYRQAIAHREIALEVLEKLDELLWSNQLSEADVATVSFLKRRVDAGKIRVIKSSLY